jgi:hypothetical protein
MATFCSSRRGYRSRGIGDTHLIIDAIDPALMLQNLLGKLPLPMSVVVDHLNNFLLDVSYNLLVSFVFRAFHIEYGASHVMV